LGWDYMKIYRDIYGNDIKDGDTIAMPHTMEEGYEDKIINGYYVTKVFYNKSNDRLETDMGRGFEFAYGVVRLNIR